MTSSTDRHAELLAIASLPDPSGDINFAIRFMLIDTDPDSLDLDQIPDALDHIATIRDHIIALHEHAELPHDESARHALSLLALEYSLCPMHSCDYAICFDDDNAECATIRSYFPQHDT